MEVEEPDGILPRLVLRRRPQGLRVVDGLSGEDGDVVGVDLDSLEAVLNTLRLKTTKNFEIIIYYSHLVAVRLQPSFQCGWLPLHSHLGGGSKIVNTHT